MNIYAMKANRSTKVMKKKIMSTVLVKCDCVNYVMKASREYLFRCFIPRASIVAKSMPGRLQCHPMSPRKRPRK